MSDSNHELVSAWAKRYYFASRSVLETVLRPYDLGVTQFAVLYHLADRGPTMQRDLVQLLHIERASTSGIVATLLRKELIEQVANQSDRRQRLLRMTEAGTQLWETLPDPVALILEVAFEGADQGELATAVRVLQAATQRLNQHVSRGNPRGEKLD